MKRKRIEEINRQQMLKNSLCVIQDIILFGAAAAAQSREEKEKITFPIGEEIKLVKRV